MWKISEVKEKGRIAFKANYWMCVLVAVIVALVGGGLGGGSGFRAGSTDLSKIFNKDKDKNERYEKEYEQDFDDYFDDDFDRDYDDDDNDGLFGDSLDPAAGAVAGIAVFMIFAVIFVIVFVISFAIKIFLVNPVQLGCNKFFVDNLEEPSGLSPVGTGFTVDYKNVIKVLFFRDLFLFLWALIPIAGIVLLIMKSYEYKMIPYLLAENPELSKDEAFEMSKEMMHGQKWSAFGLDLSFIGWALLSVITFGILGIFYVNPYINSTHAALYDTLKEETGVANA